MVAHDLSGFKFTIARATMIARAPRSTVLQCRHKTRDGGSRHLRIAITLVTRVALTTVIARVPRRTLLQCRHVTRDGGSRPLKLPIHCRTRYSDRTCPGAYVATVSTRNPRWWLTTSQDSNHTRYSDRTRPETYVATVVALVPMRTLLQ